MWTIIRHHIAAAMENELTISAKHTPQSKDMNDQVTSLPLSDVLQTIQYVSAKFHLVSVVTNFLHNRFYIQANQKTNMHFEP